MTLEAYFSSASRGFKQSKALAQRRRACWRSFDERGEIIEA